MDEGIHLPLLAAAGAQAHGGGVVIVWAAEPLDLGVEMRRRRSSDATAPLIEGIARDVGDGGSDNEDAASVASGAAAHAGTAPAPGVQPRFQNVARLFGSPLTAWEAEQARSIPVGFWAQRPPPDIVAEALATAERERQRKVGCFERFHDLVCSRLGQARVPPPEPEGHATAQAVADTQHRVAAGAVQNATSAAGLTEAGEPERLPWPRPQHRPSNETIRRLGRLAELLVIVQDAIREASISGEFVHYMGLSWCRLGCSNALCAEEFASHGYRWPEGYAHYLRTHSVEPPAGFESMLRGVAAELGVTDAQLDANIERLQAARRASPRLYAWRPTGGTTGRGIGPRASRADLVGGRYAAELPSTDIITSIGDRLVVWEAPGFCTCMLESDSLAGKRNFKTLLLDTQPPSTYAGISALGTLPDGRVVAAMDHNGAILVWHKPSVYLRQPDQRPAMALGGHTRRVDALLMLRNGGFASAGRDGMLRIWQMPPGAIVLLATVAVEVDETIAAWAMTELSDGRIAVTRNTSRQGIWIYRLDPATPATAICDAELARHPGGGRSFSASNIKLFLVSVSGNKIARLEAGSEEIQVWTIAADGRSGRLEVMSADFPTHLPGSRASVSSACSDKHGRLVIGYDILVARDTASAHFGGFAVWNFEPSRGGGAVREYVSNMAGGPVKTLLLLRSGDVATFHDESSIFGSSCMRVWSLPPPVA